MRVRLQLRLCLFQQISNPVNPIKHFFPHVLFSFLACAATVLRAGPAPANDDKVVNLSGIEVTADRIDFNKWIKVTSPHFVIYTDASTKETRLLAKQLEMTQQAVQFYFHRPMREAPPLFVVLPTSESDWRKVKSTHTKWKPASVLLERSRGLVLLDDDWQEYPGYLLAMVGEHACHLMNIKGPTWFSSGLTSFFSTITFRGDTLEIGKEGAWSAAVVKHGFMPWERFFKIDENSPEYYTDSVDHQRFFGQSTALIHYLLTNSDKKSVPKLLEWATVTEGKEKPSEQDFKNIFGTDYIGMEGQVKKLLFGGRYTSGSISFPPQALKFDIQSENVRPREMRELFILSQAMVQRGEDSLAAIDAMVKTGLKNENLRELLADSCVTRGRGADGLKQYKLLIDGGSTNAAVFENAAVTAMSEAKVFEDLDHHFKSGQDRVQAWAKHSIELDPLYFDAYNTLAWIHACGTTVDGDDVAVISQLCHALSGRGPTDEPLAALGRGVLAGGRPEESGTGRHPVDRFSLYPA